MAQGWIGKRSGETAAALYARLAEDYDDAIHTSSRTGSTIAYSANGLILRQSETVLTWECRGLTEEAANLLLGLKADTSEHRIYYHAIHDTDGNFQDAAAVYLMAGSKTEVNAVRANEAHGWTVTITTVTYGAADADGWTTTRPAEATTTGIITDARRAKVRSYTCIANGKASTATVYADITTREYTFLTQAEATAKVHALNNSSGTGYKGRLEYPLQQAGNYTYQRKNAMGETVTETGTVMWTRYYYVYVEADAVDATAKFVDAEHGWTVTATTTTYSGSGDSPWSFRSGPYYFTLKWWENRGQDREGFKGGEGYELGMLGA